MQVSFDRDSSWWRNPAPTLYDAELLTIEIVGELPGLDTDKAIFRYFRRHYAEWFSTLGKIHHNTFTTQAEKPMEG